MSSFYPTLISDHLVETVNFYEDYFGFVPAIETDGFVLMRQNTNHDNCIAVFDTKHECMASVSSSAQGIIVNIVAEDVKSKYDSLYMEGLKFHLEFGKDLIGLDHFVVYDPNGIMVNVHAPLAIENQTI